MSPSFLLLAKRVIIMADPSQWIDDMQHSAPSPEKKYRTRQLIVSSTILFLFLLLGISTTFYIQRIQQQALDQELQTESTLIAEAISSPTGLALNRERIQGKINLLRAQEPRMLEISVIGRDLSGRYTVLASTTDARIDKIATSADLEVVKTGQSSFYDDHRGNLKARTITYPLHTPRGETTGAVSLSLAKPDHTDRATLIFAGSSFVLLAMLIGHFFVLSKNYEKLLAKHKTDQEELIRSERQLRTVIDLVPHMVFARSKSGQFLMANKATERAYGLTSEELCAIPGDIVENSLYQRRDNQGKCDDNVLSTGRPCIGCEERFSHAETTSERTLETSIIPFDHMEGKAIIGISIDVTERKQMEKELRTHRDHLEELVKARTAELTNSNKKLEESIIRREQISAELEKSLAEKDLLLQEIHHRVKNNLQIVASLLDMAGRRAEAPGMEELCNELSAKVHGISLVHTQLYRSDNFNSIDMAAYIRELNNYLVRVYNTGHIKTEFNLEELHLPIVAAAPLGMVLNELLTNAYKHAFRDAESGTITMSIENIGNTGIRVCISDDGPGLPEGFDPRKANSMGMKLLTNIVQFQLRGTVDYPDGPGTTIVIEFDRTEVPKASPSP